MICIFFMEADFSAPLVVKLDSLKENTTGVHPRPPVWPLVPFGALCVHLHSACFLNCHVGNIPSYFRLYITLSRAICAICVSAVGCTKPGWFNTSTKPVCSTVSLCSFQCCPFYICRFWIILKKWTHGNSFLNLESILFLSPSHITQGWFSRHTFGSKWSLGAQPKPRVTL